jgi:hypothetical protein
VLRIKPWTFYVPSILETWAQSSQGQEQWAAALQQLNTAHRVLVRAAEQVHQEMIRHRDRETHESSKTRT